MNSSINTNCPTQQRYFLVNTDCLAIVLRSKKKTNEYEKEKELGLGTIVKEHVTDRHDRSKNLHKQRQLIVVVFDTNSSSQEVYAVDIKYLTGISEDDANLFLAVPRPRERIALYQNKDKLNEAKSIKEGSHVLVTNLDEPYIAGTVIKKGTLAGHLGIQFVVKTNNSMKDDHDALILPFSNLRLNKSQGNPIDSTINISTKIQQQLSPNSSQVGSGKTKNENKPFNLNERVVWCSDEGDNEPGTVRYLGVLPGETEKFVGVEFDRAVGTGDGRYKDKMLFKTNPKHAAFIPIGELKRKKDVTGQKTVNFFKSKKKDKESKKQSGTSTFYDDRLQISKIDEPSKVFKEYQDKQILSAAPPITFNIARQIIKDDDGAKIELKSSQSSPKSIKQSSPLHSPVDSNDEINKQRSPSNSPYSAKVQVKRFPTSTEPSSPALNQDKRFLNEQPISIRSTSMSKLSYTDHQPSNVSSKGSNRSIPSPKQYKRNSSTLDNFEQRFRSTQSSERNIKSDIAIVNELNGKLMKTEDKKYDNPIVSEPYDKWLSAERLGKEKNKEENKPELWSEVVKGKSKVIENRHLLEFDPLEKKEFISSHKVLPLSPESPSMDYYHVMKDDCEIPEPEDVEISLFDDLDKFLSLTDNSEMAMQVEQMEFGVGSVVEVTITKQSWYGVIRWIGTIEDRPKIAGLEMDETHIAFCDGELNGVRHFKCPPQKGFFVYLHLCRKDSRFLDSLQININEGNIPPAFGSKDCPVVAGEIPPLSYSEYVFNNLFGKNKGIQGHHNSCYLDATLFSMFTFTPVFDDLLNRPPTSTDIDSYNAVQRVLKEEIVNPLRRNMYVRADRVMGLRTLLDRLSSVSGLTSEEKDPEEFLNSLLHQILKAEPYLKLSSGQEAFFYQLFIEKNESLKVPTVQQLFDQSFLTSDIKLKEIPSCLIIQMPRHGKQYKMYNRIFPSPILDITDVLEDTPRECCSCGDLAQHECRDCFYSLDPPFTLKAFCKYCLGKIHQHDDRRNHKTRKFKVLDQFRDLNHMSRVTMELFAVVCIETSHYVAFAKCGNEADVPWCFFDSMADRRGEQNGYNIPEIVLCKDLSDWLSEAGFSELEKDSDRPLPEMPKRLFSDAYLCMYQNSSVMMYH